MGLVTPHSSWSQPQLLQPSLLPYLTLGTPPLHVGDTLHGWLRAAEVRGQLADIIAEELSAPSADEAEICVLLFRVFYHLHTSSPPLLGWLLSHWERICALCWDVVIIYGRCITFSYAATGRQ